jgi:O-antigen/teichoic acid export membrane protein
MASRLLGLDSETHASETSSSAGVTRDQIRGSSLLLAGNVFSLAVTFLPHLFLVRYLPTDAYGHLAYALSLVAVCKTYALGFNEAMSRFVPIYHARSEYSKALGSVVVVFATTFLISAFFIAAFSLASEPILALMTNGREPSGTLLILMFLIPLETTEVLIMNLFACFGKTTVILWGRYIVPPGLRAIAIIFTISLRRDLQFLAVGYSLAEVVTVLPFGLLLILELRRQKLLTRLPNLSLSIREIFGFSVPLMASNIIGLLGSSLPVLLLGYFHPISTVAYYRVVLPAAILSNMILGNFMPLYMPSASRLFAKGDQHGINDLFWQTSLWMSALAFPIFLATFCFSQPLTTFLYGERYAPSSRILAVLSLGYFSNVIFGFNGVTLKVLGKIRLMVLLNIVTPIAIVVLNLLLIPRYGSIGAAVATSIGVIFQNLFRQFGLKLAGGVSFFEKRFLPFFFALGLSALALLGIQSLTPHDIYLALALVAIVSAFVLWLVKKHLRIADTFPELLRLPIVGKLFSDC